MSSENKGARVVAGHHGGGWLAPLEPGRSGNPGGRPKSLKDVRDLCRSASVDAANALIGIIRDIVVDQDGRTHNREDGRIVVVAAQTILTWGYGKPPDYNPNEDRPPVTIDTSKMSTEEKIQVLETLKILRVGGVLKEATDEASPTQEAENKEPW